MYFILKNYKREEKINYERIIYLENYEETYAIKMSYCMNKTISTRDVLSQQKYKRRKDIRSSKKRRGIKQ